MHETVSPPLHLPTPHTSRTFDRRVSCRTVLLLHVCTLLRHNKSMHMLNNGIWKLSQRNIFMLTDTVDVAYSVNVTLLLASCELFASTAIRNKMAQRGLPPAHPSLPAAPRFSTGYEQNSAPSSFSTGSVSDSTQRVLPPAFNYRANASSQYMSSHYTQAYMQTASPGWYQPSTTAQGYTSSSTYNPGPSRAGNGNPTPAFRPTLPPYSQTSSWYQPGGHRCTYKGCAFTGSQKTVEVHMMDRHLIYPPGWEKRNKQNDWDADPSLKGYVELSTSASPILTRLQKKSSDHGYHHCSRFTRGVGSLDHGKEKKVAFYRSCHGKEKKDGRGLSQRTD
jgi:hypothetical protein